MRKYIFAAAIAVCLALPGSATASPCPVQIEMEAPAIGQHLLEQILKAVEAQTNFSYGCLCDMYAAGEISIEKSEKGGYAVKLSLADGSILDIALEDGL